MNIGLCVPTYNAAPILPNFLSGVNTYNFTRKLAIDSSSRDSTAAILSGSGFEVITIPKSNFDHGGTRQFAVETLSDCDIIIFLTQDAVLVDSTSIENILSAFENPHVAIAYGRQLPRKGARPIETHARIFSYPDLSRIKTKAMIPELGLRTAIVSNSFAAYRRSTLLELGGFPHNTLFGEDTLLGAKAILAGHAIAYVGSATVYHSHNYTITQEFRRYFDNGAFYSRESWILGNFGKAEGSGSAFVISEIQYLLKHAPHYLPKAILSTFVKFAGYKAGSFEKKLPNWIKFYLSMNAAFWKTPR